jgi:DNA-binding transcriptional MerR regulator/methylmalonyl-CoA mutase cobalamin-binding subunit
VSNRTGIGPHTLRVWERRYGFPKPERRDDGVRAYSEADITKLKLIAQALEAGFRAGEVVPLPSDDLVRLLDATHGDVAARPVDGRATRREATRISADADRAAESESEPVGRILEALVNDDIVRVQSMLHAAARKLGPKKFVTDVAHRLALRVGELWERNQLDVRHEHLLSACLTRQLHAFDASGAADDDSRRRPIVLLATLPGEHHLLPLDMVAVYLSASGAAPRMLGADTPPREIAASAQAMAADVVGVSIASSANPARVVDAVRELLDHLPRRVKLWLGGAESGPIFHALDDRGIANVDTWAALDANVNEVRRPKERRVRARFSRRQ